MNSYKFINNRSCKYFPCHKGIKSTEFNCLFCYCPLYALGDDCGGNFVYTKDMIKDCSNCIIPHSKKSYDYMMEKAKLLVEIVRENKLKKNNSDE